MNSPLTGAQFAHKALLDRIAELEAACDGQWKTTVRQRERAEQAEASNTRLKELLADYELVRKQAESALAERERQWAELRLKMQGTAKAGIDTYVRRNAKDFLKMMARAEGGSSRISQPITLGDAEGYHGHDTDCSCDACQKSALEDYPEG
jgi:hypothetical protein